MRRVITRVPSRAGRFLCACVLLACGNPIVLHAGFEWWPVDQKDLQLTTPKVDTGADAEALFWDVRVQDEVEYGYARAVLWNYIRIKIFTERGRESQSTIDLTYGPRTTISDIAARTIQTNGEIVELKKDAIFDRTIVKAGGIKVKAKSFAMPAVQVGSIIEYRWKETRNDQISDYFRLHFQRDIPVWEVNYHVKPFTGTRFGMRAYPFGMKLPAFAKEKDGFYGTSASNVPAFKEEPYMPPEDEVRAWVLIYYTEDTQLTGDKFWKDTGRRTYNAFKPLLKANGDVQKAAAAAVEGATTDDDKIHRLFDYVRAKVKNIQNESSGMSREERQDAKDNKSPADTLKHGAGTGFDINCLFAAMANSLGYDARIVRIANRADTFLRKDFPDTYFLRNISIGVKVGEEWKFFDPANAYVPYGMLTWSEEGTEALVSDPKEGFFAPTPMSASSKSATRRQAKFKLSEDGTLEGDVRIFYTGHAGNDRKRSDEGDSASELEEAIRNTVTNRMNTAEVTDIKIENSTDLVKALAHSYHVKVPGYAQRTGKRLFLQPSFFEAGYASRFPTSERRHALYFHYPWMEQDIIEIELPEGYTLDHPEAPAGMNFGKPGRYSVDVKISKDRRLLVYNRQLIFGENGMLLFSKDAYPQVKKVFDKISEQDSMSLTLKYDPAAQPSGGAQ